MKLSPLFLILIIVFGCHPARVFQVECNSVTTDAIYLVDLTVESKKELTDLGPVKLDAIDGVLFRGITGSNCVAQKPMLSQAKTEIFNNQLIHAIYGKRKEYDRYITNVSRLGKSLLTNTSKPTSQFKYRININRDLLRQDLTKAGLLKPLNSGF